MGAIKFLHSEILTGIILAALIFLARLLDVTIGTIRIISVSRGRKYLASVLGFFEILIWLIAITQIMQNLTNCVYYLAYAGGFAAGNFFGICLEEKLAMGTVLIRVITKKDASALIEFLKQEKYMVTSVTSQGAT